MAARLPMTVHVKLNSDGLLRDLTGFFRRYYSVPSDVNSRLGRTTTTSSCDTCITLTLLAVKLQDFLSSYQEST
jgi:hypothetical protein